MIRKGNAGVVRVGALDLPAPAARVTRPLPLAGIKVFDLTTAAAGPWATFLLGALGADVLHIDPPRPDIAMSVPPRMKGMGVLYAACNMNKRTVALDLTRPEERAKADVLLRSADIFVENMRPGAAGRLGLDYTSLSEMNPGIITASISGYGQVGPMAAEACTDPLAQAYCGWTSINGTEGGRGEFLRYYAHIDLTTASFAAEAILLALYERMHTGKGRAIDLSLVQCGVALQGSRIAEYLATGSAPVPRGSAAASTAPNEAFLCEDGRWIALSVETEAQWQALKERLRRDELDRPEFTNNATRVANRRGLAAILRERFATRPSRHWCLLLQRSGLPCVPILSFEGLTGFEPVLANSLLHRVGTPWGRIWTAGPPWKLSAHNAELRPAPVPGSGTADWMANS